MGRTRFEGYLRADRHFGESKTGPAGLRIRPDSVCLFVWCHFFLQPVFEDVTSFSPKNPRFFSKTKSLYLRDALMDFDIPKAGHVFDTSSSKLPVDFLGSEQIPGSNFHDLDFSIFRIFFSRFFRNRKIPKSKSWKFDTAIWSDREKKLQALKNSFRKRVQPSGYQNPCTHLGVTRVRKSWLIAIFMIENLDFVMAVWKQIT